MDATAVWDRLTRIVRETLGDETIVLDPETTANDVEGWDSLTHVQIMVAVERAFAVRFSTGELTGLANVGALVNLIDRRRTNAKGSGGSESILAR